MAEEGEHITADIAVVVTDIGANIGSVDGRVRCDGGPDGGRFETLCSHKTARKVGADISAVLSRESHGAVTEIRFSVPNYC